MRKRYHHEIESETGFIVYAEIDVPKILAAGLLILGGLVAKELLPVVRHACKKRTVKLVVNNKEHSMNTLAIGAFYLIAAAAFVNGSRDTGATFTGGSLSLSGLDPSKLSQNPDGSWKLDLTDAPANTSVAVTGSVNVKYSDGFTENVTISGMWTTEDSNPPPPVVREVRLEVTRLDTPPVSVPPSDGTGLDV